MTVQQKTQNRAFCSTAERSNRHRHRRWWGKLSHKMIYISQALCIIIMYFMVFWAETIITMFGSEHSLLFLEEIDWSLGFYILSSCEQSYIRISGETTSFMVHPDLLTSPDWRSPKVVKLGELHHRGPVVASKLYARTSLRKLPNLLMKELHLEEVTPWTKTSPLYANTFLGPTTNKESK